MNSIPFTPDLFHVPPVKDTDRNGQINFNEVCIGPLSQALADPFTLVHRPVEIHKGVRPFFIPHPKHLTKVYQDWQDVFARFDRDRSGSIDRTELQKALTYLGYKVTPQLLNILQRKYGLYCRCRLLLSALTRPKTYMHPIHRPLVSTHGHHPASRSTTSCARASF
jgi:hypothetical protein